MKTEKIRTIVESNSNNVSAEMKKSVKLDSDFQLFTGLSVENEVLGKSFKINVAGFDGTILFPRMDGNKDYSCKDIYAIEKDGKLRDYSLIQPKLIYKSPMDDWGQIVQWNSLNAYIGRLAISFEFPDITKRKINVEQVLEAFPIFCSKFQTYLEHFHQASFDKIEVNRFCQDSFSFWGVDPATKEMESVGVHRFNVTINIATSFLSTTLLNSAFEFSSGREEIRIEHIKVIEARKAYKSENFRLAIIEIAASIEIGLHFVIIELLKQNNVENLKGTLVNKKTLGALVSLAKLIGIDLIDPKLIGKLVEDRNKAIHGNIKPDRVVVKEYLDLIYKWNEINIPVKYPI